MSTTYPAHASPRPDYQTQPGRTISEYNLLQDGGASGASTPSAPQPIAQPRASKQPPPLVSPSYTPPTTPNGSLDPSRTITSTDIHSTHLSESPTDEELASLQSHPASPPPTLTPLPEVTCEVRARIPTTTGQEMFLHLYHNSADNKEHLAIVFGPYIRSKSLDAPIPGETEKDRMIRGAYVGTLFPGRTSSRIEALKREAGVASPPSPSSLSPSLSSSSSSASLQQQGLGVTLPMSPVQAPQRMEGDDAVIGGSETRTDEKQGQGEETAPSAPVDPTQEPPFVRIHSECYTGETVWSARCDCGEQLDEAARIMSLSPFGGVIIYLRQEGRGIGLLSKLKAYNLQDLGHDTLQANLLLRHPADARSYGLATAMLVDLGLGGSKGSFERERGIRLLTNNPEKVRAVEGPGGEVKVVKRVGMVPLAWSSGGKEGVKGAEVEKYISTKIEKFKHMFSS